MATLGRVRGRDPVERPGGVRRTVPGAWTSLSSVLPGQEAGFVGKNGNMDPESLFRKNIFNIFGNLNISFHLNHLLILLLLLLQIEH